MLSITKEFKFDAAHYLPTAEKGHPNARMHGHSFTVALTLEGDVDPSSGFIRSFAEIDRLVAPLRERLDHHLLNEIKGLDVPTLERLAHYIFEELAGALPELVTVTVRRDSVGESCTYKNAGKR
jgi:6-pyruvoyltetrahydropterin/6-carboxytetrahydropterin synthase